MAMPNSTITPRTLYRCVLLAFGLAVAGLIFEQLVALVLAGLIVVVIALPMSAFATMLQRVGIPRAIGVLLSLLIGVGGLAVLVALIVPVFNQEINHFAKALPSIVDNLGQRLGRLTGSPPSKLGAQIQHFVKSYTGDPAKLLGPLASVGEGVVAAMATVLVIVLTALYSAIHPEPLVNGAIRMVSPSRRPQTARILSRLADAYLSWLRGLVIGMVVLGGLTYVGLLIVGLPFAAFFAGFTAIAMIVPYFGALISSLPPILFALTISPGKAVIVALIYIVAHEVESMIIQPVVVGRTVKLHPAVVAIGVVAVERLFGFVGLIVAVPILLTVKIIIDELWVKSAEHTGQAFTGEVMTSPAHDVVSVAGAPAQRPMGARVKR